MACDIITESAAQLFARLTSKNRPSLINLSPEIIPENRPQPKQIIEISGESNIGKTIHLMELIAVAFIPKEFSGKGAAVIIIDTNSSFHVPFLMPKIIEKHVLHHRMVASRSNDTEDLRAATGNVKDIVLNSMKKMMIFTCYSRIELDLILLNCDDILTVEAGVSMIVIDSIDSFYWTEAATRTQNIRMNTYLRKLLKELRKLNDKFQTVLVYTKSAGFGSGEFTDEPVDYSIQLKNVKTMEIFEAQMVHMNQQYSRRYTINEFGIQWMLSDEGK